MACADITKAEDKGAVVFYATDIKTGTVKVLKESEKFNSNIKTSDLADISRSAIAVSPS